MHTYSNIHATFTFNPDLSGDIYISADSVAFPGKWHQIKLDAETLLRFVDEHRPQPAAAAATPLPSEPSSGTMVKGPDGAFYNAHDLQWFERTGFSDDTGDCLLRWRLRGWDCEHRWCGPEAEIDAFVSRLLAARGEVEAAETKVEGGLRLIAAERQRQIDTWGDDHDDEHCHGELAIRGAELAVHGTDEQLSTHAHGADAWGLVAKHGHDKVRSLTIAGALICAELDRTLRGEPLQVSLDDTSVPTPDDCKSHDGTAWGALSDVERGAITRALPPGDEAASAELKALLGDSQRLADLKKHVARVHVELAAEVQSLKTELNKFLGDNS